MEFLNYTKKLNQLAISKQNELVSEIINEEDVVKAIAYLNNIYLEDTGDCLIFLSALNLCNTYVKQNNPKITYSFKKCIEYFINNINNKDIKDLTISKSKNNGTLFIFQIGHIQFSFHDEKKVEINQKYLSKLSWDGIKKQKCAKSIFNSTINNKIRTTNKTYNGNNLQETINKISEAYQLETTSIENLMAIKI